MTDSNALHPNAVAVAKAASEQGIVITIVEYPNGTRTAQDAADAVGCQVDQIVKSMIFEADGDLVLALTSGANQVDAHRLAELAGAKTCGRANPDQVRATTGYAIGGVPPFGHQEPVRTWIDPHLMNFDRVWAAAGTPRHVFPIEPRDLVRLTNATVRDFTDNPQVGVGSHPKPWPEGKHFDPELLKNGDRRNVTDQYRYWTLEAIVADLDQHRHSFHVAIENWQHDFNIGTVVRNANAFMAAEIHIVGKKRWNRRGAMVTDRYQHVRHHPDIESFQAWAAAEGLPLIGIDNLPGSTPLETDPLPKDCVLVFGQEGPGLSEDMRPVLDQCRSIAQFGSTRSINAGVAAGIAMHSWIQSHALNTDTPNSTATPNSAG